MKRLSLMLFALGITLGLSVSAWAQGIGSTVTMTYNGVVNGSSIGGDYAGPYLGTINGGPLQDFVCDDDTSLTVDTWTAVVGQSNPVSSTVRFTPSNINSAYSSLSEQEVYNVITWLAVQILDNPSNGPATYSDPQLNAALWAFTDNFCGNNAATCTSNNVLGVVSAALAYKDTYNGDLYVYTPTSGYLSTDQEFLGTPEPISMALMGTFLSLAGFGLGKKKLFSKS